MCVSNSGEIDENWAGIIGLWKIILLPNSIVLLLVIIKFLGCLSGENGVIELNRQEEGLKHHKSERKRPEKEEIMSFP